MVEQRLRTAAEDDQDRRSGGLELPCENGRPSLRDREEFFPRGRVPLLCPVRRLDDVSVYSSASLPGRLAAALNWCFASISLNSRSPMLMFHWASGGEGRALDLRQAGIFGDEPHSERAGRRGSSSARELRTVIGGDAGSSGRRHRFVGAVHGRRRGRRQPAEASAAAIRIRLGRTAKRSLARRRRPPRVGPGSRTPRPLPTRWRPASGVLLHETPSASSGASAAALLTASLAACACSSAASVGSGAQA